MSANSDVLRASDVLSRGLDESATNKRKQPPATNAWNPEAFAREQIRTLVRRVFLNTSGQMAKQVVFCAAASNPEVRQVCEHVGEALARETPSEVAIVVRTADIGQTGFCQDSRSDSIKSLATQIGTNLWHLPAPVAFDAIAQYGVNTYWLSLLAKLRNEFEYSVIQGPAAGVSSEAELLGELADGLILVLGAQSARRASVLKIKESLEAGHLTILGTVLSGRSFPIPEQIYRRL